jgi:hypothetical protein
MFENKKLALFRTKLTDKIDFLEREKKSERGPSVAPKITEETEPSHRGQ